MRNVPAGRTTTPPPAEAAALIALWIGLVLSVVMLATAPDGANIRVAAAPDAEHAWSEKLDEEELIDPRGALAGPQEATAPEIPRAAMPTTPATRRRPRHHILNKTTASCLHYDTSPSTIGSHLKAKQKMPAITMHAGNDWLLKIKLITC
jgi:hypothetical protein